MVADQIRTLVTKALGSDQLAFRIERPKQPEHGDYATNAALLMAKQEGRPPREVATELADRLQASRLFEAIEVAGPGFLNFRVAPATWHEQLAQMLKAGRDFGRLPAKSQTVQVEFISANPTGPLTLGNGRGGFGGDVLANVLDRAGYRVEREYYLNDAGNQVRTLGAVLKGEAEGYHGAYVDELKAAVDLNQDALAVGQHAARVLQEQIAATVERMGIAFDTWFSEQRELHQTKEVQRTLHDLDQAEGTFNEDGALWLRTSKFGDAKDRVLCKSDGELTYFAADLAYHYHKLAKRQFDRAINIWGADHHGYVDRLMAGVEWLRRAENFSGQLEIVITQLVRLVAGGKEVKMSKRAGTYVTLDELLDQIPVDVARFFFVMKSFDTHMDFDLDLAKEQSQKNPVYYLQYAHARMAGILDKAGSLPTADLDRLTEPAELALIRELAEFPSVISQTAEDYHVQRLPHYAVAVADCFHRFYEQCQVVTDDPELTAARVALVNGTKSALGAIGDTIGISMPDQM